MAKSIFGICLALILLFSISGQAANSGNQTDSPLLYYYSDEQSAFLIESADGSTQEVLAEFERPRGFAIQGPGWSPSGTWFAWHGTAQQVYAVNRDTGVQIAIPTSSQVEQGMFFLFAKWSPNRDVLSVVREQGLGAGYTIDVEVQVHDLDRQTVVFEQTMSDDYPDIAEIPFFQSGLRWHPEQDVVFWLYQAPDEPTAVIKRIDVLSGTVQEFQIGSIAADENRCILGSFSRLGWLYNSVDQTLMNGTESFELDLSSEFEGLNVARVYWNSRNDVAMVYFTETCRDAEQYQAGLLSIEDQTITWITEVVPYGNPVNVPEWNVDDIHVWVRVSRAQIAVINVDTKSMDTIDLTEMGVGDSLSVQWWENILLLQSQYDNDIYAYDPILKIMEPLSLVFARPFVLPGIVFSPSGRYIASVSTCIEGTFAPCIIDTTSDTFVQLPPNEVEARSQYGVVRWHSNEEWLLFGEFIHISYSYVRVSNVNGSIIRDIGYCFNNAVGLGWVPERR